MTAPKPGVRISIRLGNAEMLNGANVADALRRLADDIETATAYSEHPVTLTARDLNGNPVGQLVYTPHPEGEYHTRMH